MAVLSCTVFGGLYRYTGTGRDTKASRPARGKNYLKKGESYLNNGTDPVIAAIPMKMTKIPMAHLADSFCHSPMSKPVRFSNR